MIKMKILAVGKIKEKYHIDAQNEYVKRLSKYAQIEINEIADSKIPDNASIKVQDSIKEEEAIRVLKLVHDDDFVILLDLHGEELDSVAWAKKFDAILGKKKGNIIFVIGGSLGLGTSLIKRANYRFKLSNLTFTHQMTRIILLEQIYRAFKILNNETYHK